MHLYKSHDLRAGETKKRRASRGGFGASVLSERKERNGQTRTREDRARRGRMHREVLRGLGMCVSYMPSREHGVLDAIGVRARDSRYPERPWLDVARDAAQNTRPARAALFITTAAGAQAATLCRHSRSQPENPRDTAGQISFYYTCRVSAVG